MSAYHPGSDFITFTIRKQSDRKNCTESYVSLFSKKRKIAHDLETALKIRYICTYNGEQI
jgi:hypothetical protein